MFRANIALKRETPLPIPLTERQSILILDDSSFDRLRIRREITKAGVMAAIDEISCLCHLSEALAGKTYDFVVIDYFLPDGTGDEAVDMVLADQNNFNARLVLVSGNPWIGEASIRARARQVEFINKSELGHGHFLNEFVAQDR